MIKYFYKILLNLFLGIMGYLFYFIVMLLPLSISRSLGRKLGLLAFYFLKKPGEIILGNLKLIYPGKSDEEYIKMKKNVFIHFGEASFEFFSIPKINREFLDKHIVFEGREYLDSAYRPGTPLLWLSGHIGNWELLNHYMGLSAYPMNVIGREVNNRLFNRLLIKIRTSGGSRCILRTEDSARQIIAAIKKNEIVGFLIDQDTTRVPGIFRDFLGKKAYTPIGLAVISRKFNIPVLPGFLLKKDGKYLIKFYKSVLPDKKTDAELTAEYNEILSDIISKYPEQWVWFHERWKTIEINYRAMH